MYKDSLLWRIVSIPINEWEKSKYYFILKLPYFLVAYIIFIPVALIFDFFIAIGDISE